ncbi:DUF1624 domain-containing protein [Hoeflea sp. G2-23]|uniref:DUF1624 domain-containing protein n=1 Tax=Hoeflea algicola TaxID=2983763 RepID=A0ABT3Z533_9HYPH|nr:DUF1624 domain-containing protein [Hoeflea algicola]MCY0146874.1 DUF1624 domain-containing protein [Hoeflea algicola]
MTDSTDKALPAPKSKFRLDGLDLFRGLALFAMATYHLAWDLELFGYLDPGTANHGWLKIYARSIAASFLFVAGASLALAYSAGLRPRAYIKRLVTIVAAAALITIATIFATPDAFIFFGILHAIAAASVIGLLFLRLPGLVALLAGVACLILPQLYGNEVFNTIWLYWVGLSTIPPRANDYVPLLPWLGPFLIGLGCAQLALRYGLVARLARYRAGNNLMTRVLRLSSRHSLAFYLLHQPVLIALVWSFAQLAPAQTPDPLPRFISKCEASCARDNDANFCTRFCGCVTDELLSRSMFDGFVAGTITPDTDSRVNVIAEQCTAKALP